MVDPIAHLAAGFIAGVGLTLVVLAVWSVWAKLTDGGHDG